MSIPLQSLLSQARMAASRRGHAMRQFEDGYSLCLRCSMDVQVLAKPQPNQTHIAGPAVALNCPEPEHQRRDDMVAHDHQAFEPGRLWLPRSGGTGVVIVEVIPVLNKQGMWDHDVEYKLADASAFSRRSIWAFQERYFPKFEEQPE